MSSEQAEHPVEESPLSVSERARLRELENEVRELRKAQVAQRQAEVAQKTFEEQLLRAEDVRVVVAPTLQGGGRCTFIVSRKLNRALYLGTNMPDPGQGRHYQLWTVTGTKSKNNPDLDNPVPSVRPWRQFFRGDVAQADFLAVSIEPDGSTPAVPTSDQIVVLAQLPS